MPRSKDRLPLKELSINSLSWSGPADSHFYTHFFISVLYLIINQAGQVQLQPGLNGGGLCTKSRMLGKSREVKGQVSGAPHNIQEPSSKFDN